ncbi:hypothetical protein Tco_0274287, partial [Tanacetum coccineum]
LVGCKLDVMTSLEDDSSELGFGLRIFWKGSLSNYAGYNCSLTPSEMIEDCVSCDVGKLLSVGAS